MVCRRKKAAVLGRDLEVTAAKRLEQRKSKRAQVEHESWRAFGRPAHFPIQPARRPPFAAFGRRLLLFADGRLQRSRIPPPQQIPSKWPLRKLLSALPRRTSPWAPRSARVRHPEPASSATRDHHNRHSAQKLLQPGPLTNNMSLQASSSSALPVSSPPSTTPSSTSPISRTSEQYLSRVCEFERICGHWHFRKMVQRLTWVIPVAVRPSPVSPVV